MKSVALFDLLIDLVISPLHVPLDVWNISNQPAQHSVCYVWWVGKISLVIFINQLSCVAKR